MSSVNLLNGEALLKAHGPKDDIMITQDILSGQNHRSHAKRLHKRSHPNLQLASYGDSIPSFRTVAQEPISVPSSPVRLRLVTAERTARPRRKRLRNLRAYRTALDAITLAFLFPLTAFTIGRVLAALLP